MNTPDLAAYPVRMDRRQAAAFLTQHYFLISPRSLEVWPLTWVRLNGKATAPTSEYVAVAERMLAAAPPIRGGKRPADPHKAAA